jgi:hypothetical protein
MGAVETKDNLSVHVCPSFPGAPCLLTRYTMGSKQNAYFAFGLDASTSRDLAPSASRLPRGYRAVCRSLVLGAPRGIEGGQQRRGRRREYSRHEGHSSRRLGARGVRGPWWLLRGRRRESSHSSWSVQTASVPRGRSPTTQPHAQAPSRAPSRAPPQAAVARRPSSCELLGPSTRARALARTARAPAAARAARVPQRPDRRAARGPGRRRVRAPALSNEALSRRLPRPPPAALAP